MQGETLGKGVASQKAGVGEGERSRDQGMRDRLLVAHGKFFASGRLRKHSDRR